jgi:hypothetical protein
MWYFLVKIVHLDVLYYISEEIKSRLNFGTFATIHSDCVFLSKTEKFKMLKTGLSHGGMTEKMVLRRILGPKREKQEADGIIYSYFLPNSTGVLISP